jgi:Uncharacterized protein conserved in bacteria
MRHLTTLIFALAAALIAGCSTTPTQENTVFAQHRPLSILVLPPVNNSVEVNAPYTYLSTISKPLAEKGYYVFPVAVIDQFLKENGLPTPDEMNTIPLDKIRQYIGADAVLYVTISDWGQKFQVVSSRAVVRAHARLVDTRTGTQLWDASVYGSHDNNSNAGGGLLGAVVSAVVDQVAGSLVDYTPDVARTANYNALYNHSRGLPEGPYRDPPQQP